MFTRLSPALRQQLLTTSFLLSSALGFSAFGQNNSKPDTAQWNVHYNQLKTRFFVGKDTTVNAQSVWHNNAGLPASPKGQQQFYTHLVQKAAQDSYNLNVQQYDQNGKPIKNLYNTLDSTLTQQAQTGVSLGRQNATLIKALNFDGKAWPEFTMAKYVVSAAPQTPLFNNSKITYQTLLNQTKTTAHGKADNTKAAVLLQILSGMTEKSEHVSDATYNTLKAKARMLQSSRGLSSPSVQAEIFKKAVDTHHHLIQKPVVNYVTKHQSALNRIAPALTTVSNRVKNIIPDLEIKNRTSDPQHQMRESVAGFYQLVGHDAYDLLNALQQGKGQMNLLAFYKANPRYNKKPGRAEQRTRTVLSKALLKPYHNAGYTSEFSIENMLRSYTVADACFDGTQRLVIPTKPSQTTLLTIKPVARPDIVIVKDTVEKHTDSTIVIETSKPYGYVGLGNHHLRRESFGPESFDRENGSMLQENSLGATLNLQHDFAGSKFIERNGKTFYKPGFFAVGLSADAAIGRMNYDRRDQYYNAPAENPSPSISTIWSGTSGIHLRVGPLTGYTGLTYTQNNITDKLHITYGAKLDLFGHIGKKGGVSTFGVSTTMHDANARWNNTGDLPYRSATNPSRSAAQHALHYEYQKNKWGIAIKAGMNDTYPTQHSPLSKDYIQSAVRIDNKDKIFGTVTVRYSLGGQKKTTTRVTSYTLSNGVRSDSTTTVQEKKEAITPVNSSVFTNYRNASAQKTKAAKDSVQKVTPVLQQMKIDSTVTDPYQPMPQLGEFQQQFRPGQ